MLSLQSFKRPTRWCCKCVSGIRSQSRRDIQDLQIVFQPNGIPLTLPKRTPRNICKRSRECQLFRGLWLGPYEGLIENAICIHFIMASSCFISIKEVQAWRGIQSPGPGASASKLSVGETSRIYCGEEPLTRSQGSPGVVSVQVSGPGHE